MTSDIQQKIVGYVDTSRLKESGRPRRSVPKRYRNCPSAANSSMFLSRPSSGDDGGDCVDMSTVARDMVGWSSSRGDVCRRVKILDPRELAITPVRSSTGAGSRRGESSLMAWRGEGGDGCGESCVVASGGQALSQEDALETRSTRCGWR